MIWKRENIICNTFIEILGELKIKSSFSVIKLHSSNLLETVLARDILTSQHKHFPWSVFAAVQASCIRRFWCGKESIGTLWLARNLKSNHCLLLFLSHTALILKLHGLSIHEKGELQEPLALSLHISVQPSFPRRLLGSCSFQQENPTAKLLSPGTLQEKKILLIISLCDFSILYDCIWVNSPLIHCAPK